MSTRLINGPPNAKHTFIFAHGSGAGMDSAFMETISNGLAEKGIRVLRFEFPYMQMIRATGKKRPPNSISVLLDSFTNEIEQIDGSVVIGGKSMGGRIASKILMKTKAKGCIVLGYPFHPPGRLNTLRVDHLSEISKPMLIIQGTRDPFGRPEEELDRYLSSTSTIQWLEGGDHSFATRKSSPVSKEENLIRAIEAMTMFICSLSYE